MKTTLELPDELMRKIKIRAASNDLKLRDAVEELIRKGLEALEMSGDPRMALKTRLRFNADGSITNLEGIDDPDFFDALEEVREISRQETPRDPFA